MWRFLCLGVVFTILAARDGDAAKILALFPFPGKSHFISFSNLLEELANRGHEVTVISAFPREKPLKNYIDIVYEDYMTQQDNEDFNAFEMIDTNPILFMIIMRQMMFEPCENFLKLPVIQNLMKSNKEFDLIIYEPFFLECSYAVLNKFKAPMIQISSNTMAKWMGDGVGNPYIYSYMPDLLFPYSSQMTFCQRLINSVAHFVWDLERNFHSLPKMEKIARTVYNDPKMPSLREIETNASFLLLNSHVSLQNPRPLTPNTIEVGGMHIKPPKKLPENLQKLLDEAKDGVIYFSLGSHIQVSEMPEDKRNAFINALSKIKQTVLWKVDMDSLPNKPQNVHLGKWFPQNDILAHPNVKVFITHGGLLSTQEATYFGVPLIAVPVMADQTQNARKAAQRGYAIELDVRTVTENDISNALNEILNNVQYREKAKELSKIFQDQPQKPLDRAVFWTEYVIRHNGAPHMRSASLKLNTFQYLLLDVIAVILLGCISALAIFVITCKILWRKFFSKPKSKITSKKTN